MNALGTLLPVVVALLGGLAVGLFVRAQVKRRLEQARALARAEAQGELATAAERVRARDEQLAAARGELAAARARADEVTAREGDLRARLAGAETRLEEERQQSSEKLALLQAAEAKLADAFARLSQQALSANADSFLKLARQSFETLQAGAQGDLEQRRQSIEALLLPVREQLARTEQGIQDLEKARQAAYGGLAEQVRSLTSSQEKLQTETRNLVTALRAPQVRGRWGEMQLKRAVEFAGLVDRVDFVEQEQVAGSEESTLRPDMIVQLPGGKQVVVDAKAPLVAYLEALEARDEDQRRLKLVEHARQVRDHVRKLAAKSYWSQFPSAPEFVVLFLPGETFFSAALEQDPTLIDDAFGESVLLATPTTLVALLKSVSYGWRQESLADNAREIAAAARELHDRVRVFTEHLGAVGRGLSQATRAYNQAAGSLTGRVLPQGRRIEQLGAGSGKPLAEPEPLDLAPREIPAGEREPDAD